MSDRKPKYYGIVTALIRQVLKMKIKGLRMCRKEKDVDKLVKAGVKYPLIWIMGSVEEQIFQFWRMWRAEVLCEKSYVIFTDIEEGPLWSDLSDYEGGKFGTMYILSFDAVTAPGTKPSQKGMYQQEV